MRRRGVQENKRGTCDDGEEWTGRRGKKIYGEKDGGKIDAIVT